MFNRPVIQIAGISDQAEAELVCSFDIDLYGFPLRLPVNREDLDEKSAKTIIRSVPSPPFPVCITYLDTCAEIQKLCGQLDAGIVQLHGEISVLELEKLKRSNPSIMIIKSLVTGKYSEARLREILIELTPFTDAFITDTFNPETGASGATGKTHDWQISRRLREFSEKPLILAGGLTPDNVAEAIETVWPLGVDVHTGVENISGRKDAGKLEAFVRNARDAFANLQSFFTDSDCNFIGLNSPGPGNLPADRISG